MASCISSELSIAGELSGRFYIATYYHDSYNMYKKLTSSEYRKHLGLPDDYTVDGFLVYGTYKRHPFDQFEDSLKRTGHTYVRRQLDHEFFGSLVEFIINDRVYWVAIAYGGALLSEYLHLACMFGSRHNILIGTCGGLKHCAKSLELILPTYSEAGESSANAYRMDADTKFKSDETLSHHLAALLASTHKVHRGPTVTFQALLAETQEDVQQWSRQGFFGVEMEAATVFAVSGYFNAPSAAILIIGDNLIMEQTVVDAHYIGFQAKRRQVAQDALDAAISALLQ